MKLSDYEIAWKGQWWVNIPTTFIIISVWYLLVCVTDWNVKLCIFIACAFGWTYWEIIIDKWISWALKNDVDSARLIKIGKRNLLLWSAFRVERIVKKNKN